MNEQEFWIFFRNLQKSGKAEVIAGSFYSGKESADPYGNYITSHSMLPSGYQNLSQKTIEQLGSLLSFKNAAIKTKEVILLLLAHQPEKEALSILKNYNRYPDKELEIFAEMALDECLMWNE
jgi:hypothetical protein